MMSIVKSSYYFSVGRRVISNIILSKICIYRNEHFALIVKLYLQ